MTKLFWALPIFFLMVACQQDPYADKPDDIKNAIPPWQREKPSPPVHPDELRIDSASSFYNFFETQEGRANFKGRVLIPDINHTIEVVNLSEFDGAQFDAATGDFKWTPPQGFISEGTQRNLTIKVRMITEAKENRPSEYKELVVPIFVYRSGKEPEILSATWDEDMIQEGGSYSVKILVRDLDSSDRDGSRPQIHAVSLPYTDAALVSYFSLSNRPTQGANKGEWEFTFNVNLREANLVAYYRESLDFGVVTTSALGISSVPKKFSVYIYNQVQEPDSSFKDDHEIEMEVGKPLRFPFFFLDPLKEGKVTVQMEENDFSNEVVLTCESVESYLMPCYLDADFSEDGEYRVELTGTNEGYSDFEEEQTITRSIYFNVSAQKKTKNRNQK